MAQVAERKVSSNTKAGEVLLRARGIKKSFKTGDSEVHILKGTDFSLRAGEFVAIEGRSGSGKSTLLHILGALESLDEGSVNFDGVDYTTRSPREQSWGVPTTWSMARWMKTLVLLILLTGLGATVGGLTRDVYPASRIVFLTDL